MMPSLTLFGNKVLRTAIERNLVSFPSQIPIFARHQAGDVQARVVQLYFVAGWTIREIGKRYNMPGDMVRKSLTEWRVRAISAGYIQEIGAEELPALATSSDVAEDPDDDTEDRTAAGEHMPMQLQTVPNPAPPADEAGRISILHVLLEELENGVQTGNWEPCHLRWLQILKGECIHSGLTLSTAQAERIEAALEVHPQQASDLLRDLRNRIADEERSTAMLSPRKHGRAGMPHLLLDEIATTSFQNNEIAWPRHCVRFLAALKQECMEAGMDFSLAQVKRIEDAVTSYPERLGDLLRDLRNRLADEQEHTALICVAATAPRQLTAGYSR